MKKILAALICLISVTAFAAAEMAVTNKDIVIKDSDCAAVVAYQPSADVDYKPGVDVNGKPVVPADLTPSVVKPPEKYSFDLNLDAAQILGLPVPAGTQGLMTVGKVTIDSVSGQVTWNGQPMEGDAMAALKAACAARKTPDSSQKPAQNPPK